MVFVPTVTIQLLQPLSDRAKVLFQIYIRSRLLAIRLCLPETEMGCVRISGQMCPILTNKSRLNCSKLCFG